MAHRFAIRPAVLSLAVLAATASCGSDSTAPKSSSTLSTAEATTVASAMFEQISLALSKSGSPVFDRSALPASAALVPGRAQFAAAPLSGTVTVNGTCALGGTISGTYTYNETINTDGSGSATGNFATTIAACQVSTGTRTIAVSGNLTYAFNLTLASNAALDSFNWHATGSFNWSGGSCSLDYTVAYTGTGAGATTISGTICGVNISETA